MENFSTSFSGDASPEMNAKILNEILGPLLDEHTKIEEKNNADVILYFIEYLSKAGYQFFKCPFLPKKMVYIGTGELYPTRNPDTFKQEYLNEPAPEHLQNNLSHNNKNHERNTSNSAKLGTKSCGNDRKKNEPSQVHWTAKNHIIERERLPGVHFDPLRGHGS